MLHPINHSGPDSFSLGLKLIGEALIASVRSLGSRSVETHWSKARDEQLSRCC